MLRAGSGCRNAEKPPPPLNCPFQFRFVKPPDVQPLASSTVSRKDSADGPTGASDRRIAPRSRGPVASLEKPGLGNRVNNPLMLCFGGQRLTLAISARYQR